MEAAAGERAEGTSTASTHVSRLPIADYALLSDCHSAALVSRGGSVDWLCFPRFDSPALFARALDDEAGHWVIRPAGEAKVTRRYIGGSLVLESRFETDNGVVVLTDAMAVGLDNRGHDLGEGAPHALLRIVRCESGEVEIETEYAPRPEYGIVHPLLIEQEGGLFARGGAAVLMLSTAVRLRIEGSTARSRFTLRAGEEARFALHHRASWEAEPEKWTPEEIERQLDETSRAWQSWSEMHQSYQGPWKELVHHSGRVLQGLTYHPTGAMVAAATTSLPETIGGSRNWDYRYCWIRDASFTLEALWVAACPDESEKFFRFLAHAAISQIRRGHDLQIMFGVGGEHDLTERELPHLSGWRSSSPVRIGNGAWDQRQLDVYGELMGAVYRLRDQLEDVTDVTREFLASVADAAARSWREKDHGIWEIRGEARHFLYSKLMCWVALDRAIAMADLLRAGHRVDDWTKERESIREAILTEGWSDQAGAFTQAFGGDTLDASNLVMPLVGFLPVDDARMRATIEAIADRLTDDRGLVLRYAGGDGLPGEEGPFLLCTFWLAEALALLGDMDRARATFEKAVRFVNDVGLLSEEVDPTSDELIGNFPQAFSHVGLINAAWAISQSEAGEEVKPWQAAPRTHDP
jgi:alpha,alpha-trehalase